MGCGGVESYDEALHVYIDNLPWLGLYIKFVQFCITGAGTKL